MVFCLERGADLHIAQLMPLPLTVSCSSKIQIGFTFLVPAHPGSPGKRAVKRVCVATYARSVGVFNNQFTANLPWSLPVKKNLNLLRFDQIMATSLWPHFFEPPCRWVFKSFN